MLLQNTSFEEISPSLISQWNYPKLLGVLDVYNFFFNEFGLFPGIY